MEKAKSVATRFTGEEEKEDNLWVPKNSYLIL